VTPLHVDVTWDPPLIRAGLPGTLEWDGGTDMAIAVEPTGPGWSMHGPASACRNAKLALRRRIYSAVDQARRDAALRRLNEWLADQRSQG
jgi:hypothetical protein